VKTAAAFFWIAVIGPSFSGSVVFQKKLRILTVTQKIKRKNNICVHSFLRWQGDEMLKKSLILSIILIIFLSALPGLMAMEGSPGGLKEVTITGHIKDYRSYPVSSALVRVYVNGERKEIFGPIKGDRKEEVESASDGSYNFKLKLVDVEDSKIVLEISKPSFRTQKIEVKEFLKKDGKYYAYLEPILLYRRMGPAFYISATILAFIYILIAFETLHRTVAALLGAGLMLITTYTVGTRNHDYYILSFDSAMHYVDWNVIFLLMGMMIIVAVMKKTGVFQWLAYKSYALAGGNVWRLAATLMIVTAVVSAFIDNVTTMLLITPISIEIALVLRISPFSLLIPEVLASNVGGTATLIGDPPNIMIGSYAGLTFNDFVINLSPLIAVVMVVLLGMMRLYYGKEYKKAKIENVDQILKELEQKYKITDAKLLRYCLGVLAIVIFLFVMHGSLRGFLGEIMEVSIPALIGSTIIIIISRQNITKILEDVEWPTLVFFIMLFIIVGATVETGVIDMMARGVKSLSGGSLIAAIMLILWVSAFASAFIDNIPFTATMLPIVGYLSETIGGGNVLWWALALGACFGGNGTYVGASANVVTVGLAERAGYPFKFVDFLKIGMPVMIVTVLISMIWLLIGVM
jgi:Na+/H+ antiporter NhaD/arsenite permease-like protein